MEATVRQTNFDAIGTKWNIQVVDTYNEEAWNELLGQLHGRIDSFDKAWSRFRPDSLVTMISKKAGTYAIPADGYKMLNFYQQLYKATGGSVTPLIGQTMSEAGYDASYSFHKKTLHELPRWEDVITYDAETITATQPVMLDFGAAGKGYLVDILGELLEAAGVHSYVINAGGDIRQRSAHNEVLVVGLENPLDICEAIGITEVVNKSLCASAGSKRKWADLHHIIDGQTLQSPNHIAATWVLADDTMTADGIATALFFKDAEKLQQDFNFLYALLHDDMSLHSSADFPLTAFEAD